jgi:general stress protein 26
MARKQKSEKGAEASGPQASRPKMPSGYGISKGTAGQLAWNDVLKKLEKSKNYWIGTTRANGRPHSMPVWGLWLDGVFYFSSDGSSRKAQNIAATPYAVVHLESGDEAVIVEGPARRLTNDALFKKVDQAYKEKYGMGLSGIPGDVGVFAVQPKVAFAWREKDFPKSATRWKF